MFDTQKGLPKNRLLAFGVEAIITKVYRGSSWLDNTDRPGFYLSKVYWKKDRLIDFWVQF